MVWPAADIEVDEHLVHLLLCEQHPDLAGLPLARLDAGWDNSLWRLGDELLVRIPRRSVAAQLAVNEQRFLPSLATQLPLPVPLPLRVGRPSGNFPWSWSIVPWQEGLPGDRATITDPLDAARRLGEFLRALHQPSSPDAPSNPYRGGRLNERATSVEERLVEFSAEIDALAARRVWERACATRPWSGPPLWLHGDLHPANTVIVEGTLGGVLDFGDICAGDPATDVAAMFMMLPLSAEATFATAYGGMTTDLVLRALGWAVFFGLMLFSIGLDLRPDYGHPTYEPIGRSTLARAIERHNELL